MIDCSVWVRPYWSFRLKSGTRSPTWGPRRATSIRSGAGRAVCASTSPYAATPSTASTGRTFQGTVVTAAILRGAAARTGVEIAVCLGERHGRIEQLGQALRRQDRSFRTGREYAPLFEQDDALDLRDDLFDVVRDQHQGRPLAGDLPNALHEAMAGDEIEAGGRLVE